MTGSRQICTFTSAFGLSPGFVIGVQSRLSSLGTSASICWPSAASEIRTGSTICDCSGCGGGGCGTNGDTTLLAGVVVSLLATCEPGCAES